MTSSWHGLRIVVTGGGSGIGAAVVQRAVALGAEVLSIGRCAETLDEVAEDATAEGPGRAFVHRDDVTTADAPERIATTAQHYLGGVDALVNNAGTARFERLEDASLDCLRMMLETNVVAPAVLTQAMLPALRSSQGCVVNVSSVGGELAMPGRSFYGASKAALNSLTRSLALELAPRVRVNAVLPGPVDTNLWDIAAGDGADDLRAGIVRGTPMARFGEPQEVAAWICHLIDPTTAGWVTGSLVAVDGGRTA